MDTVAADAGETCPPCGVRLAEALAAARRAVGADHIRQAASATRNNVGMFRPRVVHGVIRPQTVEQVRQVVRIFDDPLLECGLHAISIGHNWGLGSREPGTDHAVTLDLQALDDIRAVDLEHGWAVVEPGVTQGALAQVLDGSARMLNVTAAAADTSIVGNCLDRGMGVRRQRTDDLAGLEVVLPDGGLVRVGWWPSPGRRTAVYPHGLGPTLLPLFTQSNLGVVTAAAIRLLPRPEAQRVLRFGFAESDLAQGIEALRRWAAQGLVSGVVKVYDPVSAANYGGRAGQFLAHVSLAGTSRAVAALVELIREDAASGGVLRAADDAVSETDVVARMLDGSHTGNPARNDDMLLATLGQPAHRVDDHGLGWLFFMPMVPFTGGAVAEAYRLLGTVRDETGVRAGCTVNGLGADLVDFVVGIKFRRDAAEARQAHHALDRAYGLFSDAGFMPYRLDVDHATWIDRLSPDPGALGLTRRLKTFLDPNSAIAAGRYA